MVFLALTVSAYVPARTSNLTERTLKSVYNDVPYTTPPLIESDVLCCQLIRHC